ncbi:hypothetical protein PPACK8108_LOCUS3278 [Phakopsora pachyrhizi]|uniref:Uncharacterized protein n=1 Tax=Phakopsora pachyrhizi TaxID=170000 RepID=A0AAV0AK80_PHAPC|nr:hypothetical protein PPACK8108_LOCUS3278 [Phakopsora pachyrhizi]
MRRATVYISGCLPRPSNFAWPEGEEGREMEEECDLALPLPPFSGYGKVEAGGERGRTRHLPLPYLLLPPPASLGPATVLSGARLYGADF